MNEIKDKHRQDVNDGLQQQRYGPIRAELPWLLAAVLGSLALFVGKAFTVDDTLFLYLGQHLQQNPFDFFGFEVNWYGVTAPMWNITMNPPLAGYYIALTSLLAGWSEIALHLLFLVPAGAAAAGTYLLARRFCGRPLEASLLGLLTPVFLVSSTNLMCDTMMLAFWTWSVWLWVTGLDTRRPRRLLGSGLLAALAALTKYYGIALIPLLVAYGLLRRRRPVGWLAFMSIPALVMLGYQLATRAMYGRGLLLDAAGFAQQFRSGLPDPGFFLQTFTGLAFAGGCLLPALLLAPLIWPRRVLASGLGLLIAGMTVAMTSGFLPGFVTPPMHSDAAVPVILQAQLFCLGGLSLIGLALTDLWRRRDPDSCLLALWVLGTFFFATYLNWVNNGRSNLPLAPVLGILIVRRLEIAYPARVAVFRGWRLLAVVPGVAIALLVAHADYQWSQRDRTAAELIAQKHLASAGETYFQGHWGFQYYMERAGAHCLEMRGGVLQPGDRLVLPVQHANVQRMPASQNVAELAVRISLPVGLLHTMAPDLGAGFYASSLGPLPFVCGRSQPRTYEVWTLKTAIELNQDSDLP